MGSIASKISSLAIVYSSVYSGADQRKHQSSASLAFVRGPVNSPHIGPVTQNMFPFDDVIMNIVQQDGPIRLWRFPEAVTWSMFTDAHHSKLHPTSWYLNWHFPCCSRKQTCSNVAFAISKTAPTPSPSIRHRPDTLSSDRCLIDVDLKVFAIRAAPETLHVFQGNNGVMHVSNMN